jgi:hypothetical protein
MPGDGDLYVFSDEGDDEDGDWVSPRPVEAVVVELVTEETDVSEDEIDELDAYFDVEGHEIVVDTDGTVSFDSG